MNSTEEIEEISKESLTPTAPEGISGAMLEMAEKYQAWKALDKKIFTGGMTPDEMIEYSRIPRKDNRPVWVTDLSEGERIKLGKAEEWLLAQQDKTKLT